VKTQMPDVTCLVFELYWQRNGGLHGAALVSQGVIT